MNSALRTQLYAAIVALLFASAAVYSGARLFAELSAVGPLKAMEQWAWNGRMGSHAERQRLLSRLRMSLRVTPWSADRHMDLARFYTWHLYRSGRDSARYRTYAERIQRQLLEVLRNRPGWGFAWAALAENSVSAGPYASRISLLLDRALRYGAYEPGSLRKVALVGMLHWREIPAPMRGRIRAAVRRSLKIDAHPASLIRLAFSLQWQEQLRPLLQNQAQRREFERQLRRLNS